MFIVMTSTYPLDKTLEVTRAFIKAIETPEPDYLKRVYVLTSTIIDTGMKVIVIYEVDDDKVPDAIKYITKRMAELFYSIEGYRYQIEPMLTAEEAIPLLPL